MRDQKEKRQERFVQKVRFKAKVKNLLMVQSGKNNPIFLGMLYHTRAICSCTMCGNPRRHFGTRTIKEISFLQQFKKENK